MKFWVNIWRASPHSTDAFDATIHMSERDAIDMIADEMEEESRAYVGTIRVDGSTRDCVSWVDLNIESRLLRWRQAGL